MRKTLNLGMFKLIGLLTCAIEGHRTGKEIRKFVSIYIAETA